MAKAGGAVQKLQLKAQQRSVRLSKGTFKPLIARIDATHHEKAIAYRAHQEMIENGINPGPVDDYALVVKLSAKTGKPMKAKLMRVHSGVPDEVTRTPKTNAERAAADKRAPIKSEMRDGWKPQPYAGRRWS